MLPILFWFILISFEINLSQSGDSEELRTESLTLTFSLPDDGDLQDSNLIVDLHRFQSCKAEECSLICGTKDAKKSQCDPKNPKLCMCNGDNFYTTQLEGNVSSVNRKNELHRNCSVACNKRMSYARVYTKPDKSMQCICLTGQMTKTGITLCDEFAVEDICKSICQTDAAVCAFNGICLCRNNWEQVFNTTLPFVRKQVPQDEDECLSRCTSYHHDYRARLLDKKMIGRNVTANVTYKFREKFCTCGPWINTQNSPETTAIVEQGFQVCTGLKCKRRCGMDEALCELPHRRACLCTRESIIIGKHLWSRLPSHEETKCYETCAINGLDARVIEWNPLFNPQNEIFSPGYRRSNFQYLYDGKFCHCIQVQRDMHQYRPCTDEICRKICNHHEAECGELTRRACICNTHQLALGLGRTPDPGEINCDIACRYGLFDALIVDLKWEIPVDQWSVKMAKYCACVRPVSPAGITHCDPYKDECPKFCNKSDAYCTREKYCHCGTVDNMLANPLVRLGDGKEQDECGQKCRSWLWPLAEDGDNKPYIYDKRLDRCNVTKTCPKIDTRPWKADQPGALSVSIDALEQGSNSNNKRYCLCAKSTSALQSPGTRILPHMEPQRLRTDKVPCVTNHTCEVVAKGVHVIA